MNKCKICGHDQHESGQCYATSIEDGCICGSCYGMCTCDGESWEYSSDPNQRGGRREEPELQ